MSPVLAPDLEATTTIQGQSGVDRRQTNATLEVSWASNRQQVVDALNQIILGVRSCKFTLNGSVVAGTETQGSVQLNGSPLVLGSPSGWRLNSPTELEITGSACDTLKTSPTAKLVVRFPCGTIVPK